MLDHDKMWDKAVARGAVVDFIKESLRPAIEKIQQQQSCRHEWKKWGHGYKCIECGYYTGTNANLNALVYEYLSIDTNNTK